MTPFDGGALLAMLLAFYPAVSGPELARARRERPEYFASGTIIGRYGDALRLPDGRIFDLIYAVEGPAAGRRWQVIEPGPGGADDAFALEPGPLVPLDESVILEPLDDGEFEQLAGELLAGLSAEAAAAEFIEGDIAGESADGELDDVLALEIEPAEAQLAAHAANMDAENPGELILTSDGIINRIESHDADIVEAPKMPEAPDVPVVHAPREERDGPPEK